MSKPNFFIVGAPKSGTTSLTDYLRQHPDIYIPPGKEFHYFGSDLEVDGPLDAHVEDRDQYLSLFENAEDEHRIGEASVWYLYSANAAGEIHGFNPDSLIVAMLRNPVDMLYSQHSQFVYNGDENIVDFERALEAEPKRKRGELVPERTYFRQGLYYRETARYSEQLTRYFDRFGRDRVRVIVFDDFVESPLDVYQNTLRFLGVDPEFEPEVRTVNPNTRVRSSWLRTVFRHPPFPLPELINGINRLFPNLLHRVLVPLYKKLNSRRASRPPMDPSVRRRLQAEFRPEIERLSRLLDRDLTHWCQPKTSPRNQPVSSAIE